VGPRIKVVSEYSEVSELGKKLTQEGGKKQNVREGGLNFGGGGKFRGEKPSAAREVDGRNRGYFQVFKGAS